MAIYTPEEAILLCTEEMVRRGFSLDNPQWRARVKAVRNGKKIDEKAIVAEGGCDHADPTLHSMGREVRRL